MSEVKLSPSDCYSVNPNQSAIRGLRLSLATGNRSEVSNAGAGILFNVITPTGLSQMIDRLAPAL